MKKLYTFLLSAFIMAAGVTMFACGDEQPESYNITIEENSLVDVSTDYQLTQEGTLITVTVEPETDVYVLNVYANEEACTKVDDSTYTFTLASDTVVRVEAEMRYTEVNESEYASASELNPSQIIKTDDGYLQGWRPYLTYNFSEKIWGEVDGDGNVVSLTSSNQAVIPNEALSAEFFDTTDSDNGMVNGVDVYIDTDMIDYGETYIVFEFKELYVSPTTVCRLVKRIEVVHEEDYDYTTSIMPEAVTIDQGDVKGVWAQEDYQYFEIMILDDQSERAYGADYSKFEFLSDATPYDTIYTTAGVRYIFAAADVPDEVEISFNYLLGHSYSVNVYGFTSDDLSYTNRITLNVDDETDSGATFIDGTLTCTEENTNIRLSVSD